MRGGRGGRRTGCRDGRAAVGRCRRRHRSSPALLATHHGTRSERGKQRLGMKIGTMNFAEMYDWTPWSTDPGTFVLTARHTQLLKLRRRWFSVANVGRAFATGDAPRPTHIDPRSHTCATSTRNTAPHRAGATSQRGRPGRDPPVASAPFFAARPMVRMARGGYAAARPRWVPRRSSSRRRPRRTTAASSATCPRSASAHRSRASSRSSAGVTTASCSRPCSTSPTATCPKPRRPR